MDSTGAGLPFGNIALLNASDSVQVRRTISDEQGHYVLCVLQFIFAKAAQALVEHRIFS